MIPYGKQSISGDDIQAVIEVLQSEYLTQGDTVEKFEQAICQRVDAKNAVAVNSATSALHLACLALDLTKGDWLWTSPISFVASSNCALYCQAQVDFVDIDPITYNLSVSALEEKLEQAKENNRLPKIIIAVHLSGLPCDMQAIHQLSNQYGFKIIEDAAHALGASYQENPTGCGQYSDITVFSFHPVKIITTGEGGMAVTNNKTLADKMRLLRSHGITRDPAQMTQQPDGDWYYQQLDLGFNYRMNDIQAALGLSQLSKLNSFIKARQAIAKQYFKALTNLPLLLPFESTESQSAYHLFIIQLTTPVNDQHKKIFNYLRQNGIGVNIHYIPIHTQPYYQKLGFKNGDYPVAENYYKKSLSIPIYPSLTDDEQRFTIATIQQAVLS